MVIMRKNAHDRASSAWFAAGQRGGRGTCPVLACAYVLCAIATPFCICIKGVRSSMRVHLLVEQGSFALV
eukprot:365100-Chlamydomonas_euryale.AAC.3